MSLYVQDLPIDDAVPLVLGLYQIITGSAIYTAEAKRISVSLYF